MKYTKEFFIDRFDRTLARLLLLNNRYAAGYCIRSFCRTFKIPMRKITEKKKRIRVTIEFVGD